MKKFYSSKRVNMPVCGKYFERSLSEKSDSKGGFIGKVVEYVQVDPSTRYDGMTCKDFALENILATGAYDLLKQCQYSEGKLDVAATLENGASMMNDYLDGLENNNVEKVEE